MKIARTISCMARQPLGPLLCMLPVQGFLCPTAAMGACSSYVNGTLRISGTVTTDCVDVDTNGTIIIEDTGTLILTGDPESDSTLTGCIVLEEGGAVLRITTNSGTIGGSGAIDGYDGSAGIEIGDSVALTSSTTIRGHLEIRNVDAESGSFVNQGRVYANSPSGNLAISVDSVTDSDNGGTVSSTNFRWGVNASQAKLLFIENDATGLVGDFFVREGTLQVGEDPEGGDDIDVCSTGDILFDGGSIVTGDDDSFKCSGSCP